MPGIISGILRQASRKPGSKLNILTCSTHERQNTNLAQTGHNFFAFAAPGIKTWNTTYGKLPSNWHQLNPELMERQLYPDVDYDLILCQNKAGQYGPLSDIARQLHLPIIHLEHCLPVQSWTDAQINQFRNMKTNLTVFITEFSRDTWGYNQNNAMVIEHGIDTKLFSPDNNIICKNEILTVCNDYVNRDYCCGYSLYKEVTKGLSTHPVGSTPGLSEAAKSVDELVLFYRQAGVFLSTATLSPVPMSVLEAAACGCAIVSTVNPMISKVFEHGKSALLSNDPKEMKKMLIDVLNNKNLAYELGQNARKTIVGRYNLERFVKDWNVVFEQAGQLWYKG